MSPLRTAFTKAWPLLLAAAVAAASCSSGREGDLVFDPSTGHSKSWIRDHGAAAMGQDSSCERCHGVDLQGGISLVSCFTASMDGQSCHADGPGAIHTSGWRAAHTSTPQGQASTCAQCHRSNSGTPGCFNNTLCHGQQSQHPSGWRSSHSSTSQSRAPECAQCHRSNPGTPGCFNNTLCHGSEGDDDEEEDDD